MSLPQLLNQVITIYNKASFDEFGREVYADPVSVRARFERKTKTRISPSEISGQYQTIVIDAVAYIDGEPSIEINDKVTYSGDSYKVHSKSVPVDGQGNFHHTKVELMKMI